MNTVDAHGNAKSTADISLDNADNHYTELLRDGIIFNLVLFVVRGVTTLQSSELYYLNMQGTYKSMVEGITSAINLIKTLHEVNHITGSFVGTSQHRRNIHFFQG